MTLPLIVLAILSTVGGLVGIPYAISSLVGAGDINVFEHTLKPVIAKVGPQKDSHGSPAKDDGHGKTDQHGPAESHNTVTASPAIYDESHGAKAVYAAAAEPHGAEGDHGESGGHHSPEEIAAERWLALLSFTLAIVGIVIGFAAFLGNPLRKMPKILEDKWRIDELYNKFIIDPITWVSREGLWKGFDVGFIDGAVNGIGAFVSEFGTLLRTMQVGFVRSYAAMILFGGLVLIGFFVYYGFRLIG